LFLKKGLRVLSFFHKLTMKNPRMSEAMFAITNKYALGKEAILNTREQKKEKESGHMDQPSSSKDQDKKKKADPSINMVERPRRNEEYQPRLGDFEGFLDRICIFQPHGKHKTRECDRLQGFTNEVLKMAKGVDQEEKPEEPKGDFPKLIKRSTTSMVAPSHMSQGGNRKSQPGRSWQSHPPPPSTVNGLRSP
jgi:hypothetical protein